MSSKSSKTTTNHKIRARNHEPSFGAAQDKLTSKEEVDPRIRVDDKGRCEDCEYSRAAKGKCIVVLTCDRKDPANRLIVEGGDCCGKFMRSRELVAAELEKALAEGAKLIPLTQGRFAIVDAEDYEWLKQYKWHTDKAQNTYYAVSQKNRKGFKMHRLITGAPKGLFVDHRDHNGFNNRRDNLRLCTNKENQQNKRPMRGKTSRYKGVHRCKSRKMFRAKIRHNGKQMHLGYFENEIDAAKAYDKKAREFFGEFAFLNFPDLATEAK